MANFELYWNPVNPYSTVNNQQVEYKKREDLSYTVAAVLPDYEDHYDITGLTDNVIYDFRVAYNCPDNGLQHSRITDFISFTCPALTITRDDTTLSFSFTPIDIDRYTVILYQDGLQHTTHSFEGPFFSDISDAFEGLNNTSTYVVKVIMFQANMSAICDNGTVTVTCTLISDINIG